MTEFFSRFVADIEGATAIEYAMIAVGIAVAIVATVTLISGELQTKFAQVSTGFN